jgi:hypothetical protein
VHTPSLICTAAFKVRTGTVDSSHGAVYMLGAIEQATRGITAGVERLDSAANRIARDGADGDLPNNMVSLVQARLEVRANLAVVRTVDDMIGNLLDVLA